MGTDVKHRHNFKVQHKDNHNFEKPYSHSSAWSNFGRNFLREKSKNQRRNCLFKKNIYIDISWDILNEKELNKVFHDGILLGYIIFQKEQLKLSIYSFGQECTHPDQKIGIFSDFHIIGPLADLVYVHLCVCVSGCVSVPSPPWEGGCTLTANPPQETKLYILASLYVLLGFVVHQCYYSHTLRDLLSFRMQVFFVTIFRCLNGSNNSPISFPKRIDWSNVKKKKKIAVADSRLLRGYSNLVS